jgi:uncharacterized protein (TIGR00251 family)
VPDDFVKPSKDGALLRLRISPGLKRSSVNGLYGEAAVRLSVAAPPVDGKANAEVEKFLSKLLDVPKGDVCVIGGASGRERPCSYAARCRSRFGPASVPSFDGRGSR